jgi:hypothetical protein
MGTKEGKRAARRAAIVFDEMGAAGEIPSQGDYAKMVERFERRPTRKLARSVRRYLLRIEMLKNPTGVVLAEQAAGRMPKLEGE